MVQVVCCALTTLFIKFLLLATFRKKVKILPDTIISIFLFKEGKKSLDR